MATNFGTKSPLMHFTRDNENLITYNRGDFVVGKCEEDNF